MNDRKDFTKALKSKIKMPFLFGPIEFSGLSNNDSEQPFDYLAERENVLSVLHRSHLMP